jgi:stage II sporulation protein D
MRRSMLFAGLLTAAVVVPFGSAGGTPGALAATALTGTVVVNGGGLGHGVGMSQWGAYGQATEGASAEQIIAHYYTGTTVAQVPDAMDLRVNLLHQVPAVQVASVPAGTGGGALQVIPFGVAIETGGPGDVFTLAMSGTLIAVTKTSATGVLTHYPLAPAVTVRWGGTRFLAGGPTLVDVAGPGQALGDSTGRYRAGALEVRVVGSLMEVNDVVRLHDEYLDGVAEVPSSWPLQALRAQVIASRSYALTAYAAGLRPACGCHLYASTVDQYFAGWSKQAEAGGWGAVWTSAVASTSSSAATGEAVVSGGTVVRGYFFSSSGGRTRNSEDVWGTVLPYARSVADHWSQLAANPYNAWYRTFGSETVRTALFPTLPDLAKVLVTAKDAGGGVQTVTAWSAAGASATVSGATFVAALGLPSVWVWSVESTLPAQPAVDVLATPGYHLVAGRQWRTDCHPYYLAGPAVPKWATLCTVNIVAYRYTIVGSTVVTTYGWVVNNLTYLDADRPGWDLSPIAVPGVRTTTGGLPLRTTCTPSVATGPRQCESWVYEPVVARTATGFAIVRIWVFSWDVRLVAAPL